MSPQSGKFKLTLHKTPMMCIDDFAYPVTDSTAMVDDSCVKNTNQDSFRSRKLLNFNTSAKDHNNENANPNMEVTSYSSRINIKDILG
jgi:hypothetical protein